MSQKPLWYRWARVFVTGGSIVGTGLLLYKYTVPTDEELIAKFSPEIKAEYLKNRILRQREQEELMKIVKQTAASNEPIWKAGPIKSPFEKDGRNVDPQLASLEQLYKEEAEAQKRQEHTRAQEELIETEKLVSARHNKWFSWR